MTTTNNEEMFARIYIYDLDKYFKMPLGMDEDELEEFIEKHELKKYEWEVLELNAPFSKELKNHTLEFMNGVIRKWQEEGESETTRLTINYVLEDVIMGLDDMDDLNQELEQYIAIQSEHGDDLQAIGEHLFEMLNVVPEDLPNMYLEFFDYQAYANSFILNSKLKYTDNGVWLLKN